MKRKGIEPDECYYVGNEPRVRGRMEIKLAEDPPPDLMIEVDISSSSVDQVQRFLGQGKTANETAWIRDFRAWVLRELKPSPPAPLPLFGRGEMC